MSQLADLSFCLLTGSLVSPNDEVIVPDAIVTDPVGCFLEKAELDVHMGKTHDPDWDAELHKNAAVEKPHADGVELEKIGNATWRYTYKNGAIIDIRVDDPDLPGGRMQFDANGNEKAA